LTRTNRRFELLKCGYEEKWKRSATGSLKKVTDEEVLRRVH